MRIHFPSRSLSIALAVSWAALSSAAQSFDSRLFSDMRWREIGPLRAGRTNAVSGVPGEPNVFYVGAVNGGVWETTDSGETWQPLFDSQPTGSIGAIAVAPSDPDIIYVATGEGLARPDLSTGDGIYKSTNAGKTWEHLGLRDGQQIPRLAIDPHDPNRVFAAVTGHPYGPNEERGIYRSTDAGRTFQKVLYRADTGGSDVEIDSNNPKIIYAGMWERREGPWENGAWSGTNGGLFKSTDGGDTWRQIMGHGLPDIVQIDIAIAPSDSNRLYATVASAKTVGIYRSDDGGANWIHTTQDTRPEERIGGGDLPVPKVDPKNPDVVYICSIVTWKSTDAGKTWLGLRGSPGGDDYQNIWINPDHPEIIVLTSDQGAIVTVNGGQTWSQWYNQPTAQMYHVTADNAFPYRVCGGQQESGSACVSSRGNDGRITFHDWHPAGIEEYGYGAPDPLDPDIVYGGKLTRYDRRTGQIANVEPKPLRNYRVLRTEPVEFSPIDPHLLFFAANTIWQTRDGGRNWMEVSPDLTRKTWAIPESVGIFKNSPSAQPSQRGVVYALALSPLDIGRMWAGTDDGLIWTTADGGKRWDNVTPAELRPFWKVFNMDAGHFDKLTAYAAVNNMRLDDMRPHLFRTHDGGRTWKEIDNGIPDDASTNTIREDTERRGLLFAGTETQVYVSFDDGDHWQSLRLNMPATSVRDLQIKGDDLIAGTHGRGYLILDDITPLRQVDPRVAAANVYLYKPQTALRIRGDMNPPTPWPPEMATGENPPDGAVIDYYLGRVFHGVVSLDMKDASGKVVRHYASTDPVPEPDPRYPVPLYWARPPRILSSAPGHHRFLWDLHYPRVPGLATEPDADQAVPHNTPLEATSPWVMPGPYTIKLTAAGNTYTQELTVLMDPRVKTSRADLESQFKLSMQMYDDTLQISGALHEIRGLENQIRQRAAHNTGNETLEAFDKKLEALAGQPEGLFGRGRANAPPTLTSVRRQLLRLEHEVQNADEAPTTPQAEAYATSRRPLASLLERWNLLKTRDLAKINRNLRSQHLAALNPRAKPKGGEADQLEGGDKDEDEQ